MRPRVGISAEHVTISRVRIDSRTGRPCIDKSAGHGERLAERATPVACRSNLEEIGVGSKVVYADAAGDGTLDTDVVLDAGSGDTAAGHVVLDLAADKGVAAFSGGTGKFTGFQAHADVSTDSDGLWHWKERRGIVRGVAVLHQTIHQP